jgi:hypothetical protein
MWILHHTVKFFWSFGVQFVECPGQLVRGVLFLRDNCQTPYSLSNPGENLRTTLGTYSPDLAPCDHLFGLLKTSLVADVLLMTKRLKWRCGSGWGNSQETYMLWDLTLVKQWYKWSVLMEDVFRGKFFSSLECHIILPFHIHLWPIYWLSRYTGSPFAVLWCRFSSHFTFSFNDPKSVISVLNYRNLRFSWV